jgi:hypothetical protein
MMSEPAMVVSESNGEIQRDGRIVGTDTKTDTDSGAPLTLLDSRLYWRRHLRPFLQQIPPDPTRSTLAVCSLLTRQVGIAVGPQPDLCGGGMSETNSVRRTENGE